MSDYTITTKINQPYEVAVETVREALGNQGFGVLTEIDLQAALKEKLDADIEPQVILGACRPPLAYEAIQVEPSIAAVLPCNVVVRTLDQDNTLVEAFDPDSLMGLAENPALSEIARDAKKRLDAVFATLHELH